MTRIPIILSNPKEVASTSEPLIVHMINVNKKTGIICQLLFKYFSNFFIDYPFISQFPVISIIDGNRYYVKAFCLFFL
jgi:hypothetical protein